MAVSCSNALALIKSGASSWVTYYNRALDHRNDASTHWGLNQDHEAIEDILLALADIVTMGEQWGGWAPYSYEGPIWWYLENCVSGYTLTMDAMISVMLTATEDEYRYFIGVIDAFRVGLWNKPFNSEFYAALARGFAL